MNKVKRRLLLPAIVSAGSFLGLLLCVLLSSPIKNITYAVVFFSLLLVFLLASLTLVVYLQIGSLSRQNRYRITIVSLSFLIMAMFRSAQSLSLIDGLVLILATGGLLFYVSRRSY